MAALNAMVVALQKQSPVLVSASAIGWCAVIGLERSADAWSLCSSAATTRTSSGDAAISMLLTSLPTFALSWSAMLMAMMSPLLIQPMRYIRVRSLTRRRWRSLSSFLAGYVAVWLVAGIGLAAIIVALRTIARGDIAAALVALAIALVWQLSPFKQICLNRCHRQERLSAFGWQADIDALRYGVIHGFWCVGSCWALMLVPLAAGAWHLLVMAVMTVILMLERTRVPQTPRWLLPSLPRFRSPILLRTSSSRTMP